MQRYNNLKKAYFSYMLEVNFSPFPEICTNRLILRQPMLSDAQDMFELRSNIDVMQYVNRPIAKTIDDAVELINKVNTIIANNEGINWFMDLKDNPQQVIGNIGIWQLKKEDYRGEIGYMLHPNFWRKGLMQEAIEAVIEYGFNTMQLHSLEAKINPLNTASASILEKTGFVKEAHFKEDYFWNGKFLDTIVYSLLNK
jgi:[ribosomal protein S5]-alanine N-acetyltransferase